MSREKAQELLCSHLGPFGEIKFPYVRMGKIDSLDLFGPTELMILAMYAHNRSRWHTALDIGANLGLHSICMAKMGWKVHAFEPDPEHYERAAANIDSNRLFDFVTITRAAVHTINQQSAAFVRVLNNLTGNHLAGYKQSYGPRDTITVSTVACRPLWRQADFAKIDCEGNEADLVMTMTSDLFPRFHAVLEVRNTENARQIYEHLKDMTPLWSQKTGWERVKRFDDMPMQNRDGSLFIGQQGPFP